MVAQVSRCDRHDVLNATPTAASGATVVCSNIYWWVEIRRSRIRMCHTKANDLLKYESSSDADGNITNLFLLVPAEVSVRTNGLLCLSYIIHCVKINTNFF